MMGLPTVAGGIEYLTLSPNFQELSTGCAQQSKDGAIFNAL